MENLGEATRKSVQFPVLMNSRKIDKNFPRQTKKTTLCLCVRKFFLCFIFCVRVREKPNPTFICLAEAKKKERNEIKITCPLRRFGRKSN